MANPFDYIGPLADIPSAYDSFTKGIMTAEALDAIRRKNAAEKMALDQQVQMQSDLGQLYQNPTISGINRVMARYPAMADKFKPLLDSMNEQQKAARIQQANNVFMPLLHGDRATAIEQLKINETAAKNSGDEASAQSLGMMRKLVESTETGKAGDNMVLASVGSFLSAAMGEKEFAKTYETLEKARLEREMAPSKLTEQEARASAAATKAKFAESEAALDLQKKGWDITKIQNDIDVSKENAKIAMINASIARESNALKRDELKLKLDDHILKRDEVLRTKTADYESAVSTIDNMLSTLGRIEKTDKNIIERATGPLASKTMTILPGTADFEALVENLDAQTFLAQIPNMVGKGALSDAEGKKLTASLQNFSLRQSSERFIENVKEAQRLMLKARKKMANKYGIPESAPDIPDIASPQPTSGQPSVKGAVSVDELMSLLNKK